MTFVPFPKVTRWNREVLVSEKIDGTNGQIHIVDPAVEDVFESALGAFAEVSGLRVYAASRSRYLGPVGSDDNHGFCRWAFDHASDLVKLGPGRHFGEWWGLGINRGYGLKEKRFSLFNVSKWSDDSARPACCHVVPVLARGMFGSLDPLHVAHRLRTEGSHAAPGFMRPEGIVLFHTPSSVLFKYTLDKNDEHKESA
jgi:hypothetical protein